MAWYEKASDNFNRTDANPIGGNWVAVTAEGGGKIVSNRLLAATAGLGAMFWNVAGFSNNQYARLKCVQAAYDNSIYGPLVRVASAARTYYEFIRLDATTLLVAKMVAGTATQLGASYTQNYAQDEVLGLYVSGSTLTPEYNGSALATRTDTAIASGFVGARPIHASAVCDDWAAGDDVAPPSGLAIPVALLQYRRRW